MFCFLLETWFYVPLKVLLASDFQKSSRRLIRRRSSLLTGNRKRVVVVKNTVPFCLFANFRQLQARLM